MHSQRQQSDRSSLAEGFHPTTPIPAVEWKVLDGLADYEDTLAAMEQRAGAIASGEANEAIWLLEHPTLFTAGTSADPSDLVWHDRFPIHQTGRGGQYTYHGPGQRVIYVMLDVGRRGRDVRRFVKQLETWVISALGEFNVHRCGGLWG